MLFLSVSVLLLAFDFRLKFIKKLRYLPEKLPEIYFFTRFGNNFLYFHSEKTSDYSDDDLYFIRKFNGEYKAVIEKKRTAKYTLLIKLNKIIIKNSFASKICRGIFLFILKKKNSSIIYCYNFQCVPIALGGIYYEEKVY